VIATFCEVFPYVTIWMPLQGDLILLGSNAPFSVSPTEMARRMSGESVGGDLERIGLVTWDQLVGMSVGSGDALRGAVSGAPIQTDSRPLLEFALPKTLHRRVELAAGNMSWLAGELGDPVSMIAGSPEDATRARASASSYKAYMRGQVSQWMGAPAEAIGHYGAALSGAAGRRSALDPMYLLLCRGGLEAESGGNTENALQIYRRAVELAPGRSEANYLLGVLLAATGRVQDAEGHLRAAVAAAPARVEPSMSLADVLSQLGAHAEAAAEIRRATGMSPNDPRAWYGSARVLARAGDVDGARESLGRALAIAGPSLRQRAISDTVLRRAGVQAPPGAGAQ
jgi:tetratricopeptide (TPR) repeat protein